MRGCSHCQENATSPPSVALHPWEFPNKPWSRLHIDYAGPLRGHMFLVVIDAYSRWLEVALVPSANSANTIEKLPAMFATHGIPELIVSDNCTPFISAEFQEFLRKNDIQHCTTAPYHPASNGLAERAVQTLKRGIRGQTGDINIILSRFLLHYRVTPHSSTGTSTAELLMKRRLRTHLDQLKPDLSKKMESKQSRTVDLNTKERSFTVGETVLIHNWAKGPRWLPGVIQKFHGHVNVEVKTAQGNVHRHIDQIRRRFPMCVSTEHDDECYLPAATKLKSPEMQTEQATPRRLSRPRRQPDRLQIAWN